MPEMAWRKTILHDIREIKRKVRRLEVREKPAGSASWAYVNIDALELLSGSVGLTITRLGAFTFESSAGWTTVKHPSGASGQVHGLRVPTSGYYEMTLGGFRVSLNATANFTWAWLECAFQTAQSPADVRLVKSDGTSGIPDVGFSISAHEFLSSGSDVFPSLKLTQADTGAVLGSGGGVTWGTFAMRRLDA